MKNHIFCIGLLAVLAISCSIHEMDFKDTNAFEEFYASIENAETPDTKVYATEELYLRWNADDRITIFNKYTYNQEYRFTGETGDNSGSFKRVDNGDFVTGNSLDNIYAIYPYLESTRISDTGVITVTLPAEQKFAENTMGLGANTMISATADNQLLFKNVGGYLMLKLFGDDVTVSSITLKGNNGERIAGKATVSMPINGVPTVVMSETAGQEITLVCETPVKIGSTAETATTFWIVVPPTVFSKGFTLTVKDNNNGVFEKATSKSFEISRNKLARMSALEVSPLPPEPSDEAIFFADQKLKERLVAKFDTNGDGELSYKEAAAVTSIEGAVTIKTITSFDEFQFFTSVQIIPDDCFSEWADLTSIVFPPSIISIGKKAFFRCSSLSSVTLSENITSIGDLAFFACSSLSSIKLPFHLTIIGNQSFSYCDGLSSIVLSENLVTIGDGAFMGCSSLSSVFFSDSIKTIEGAAFQGCSKLETTSLPQDLVSLGNMAFADCSSLTRITLPKSLSSIDGNPFSGCTSLGSIIVEDGNCKFNSRDNCNAIIHTESNSLIAGCKQTIIPQGVTTISSRAFFKCSGLTSVSIPNSVNTIEDYVFYECNSLTTVSIPESVTSIWHDAFTNCTSLTYISIPESISTINDRVFSGCSALTSVSLSDSVREIETSAFYGCSSLLSIVIPEGVRYIGASAFSDCISLSSITVCSSTPPGASSRMFYQTNNCPIYVPAESIDAYKSAQYWSNYADRIQAISSVPLPEAVDLGLSVKWASFNLGASKPEEYGDYYAWGETETKTDYSWSTYKWASGSSNSLSKYINNGSYGPIDNKTVLEEIDDVAHIKLGGKWRMPTIEEWMALHVVENFTWTWTDNYENTGVAGRIITSHIKGFEGSTIFLPAADPNAEGQLGSYWSSSLRPYYPDEACELYFNAAYVDSGWKPRYLGFSIRPVYAE